ncbi:hypothetical protein Fmac_007863 [Flemingia macrophylla]|uniref:Uncharacterized protein n=1 Tax=Flemingia macrophylla TaxID=520843 RepID=A0ABD1MVS1_9FABA
MHASVVIGNTVYAMADHGDIAFRRGRRIGSRVAGEGAKKVGEGFAEVSVWGHHGYLGGKLCVVWECQGSRKEIDIWCTKIGVKKNPNRELWGQLGWSRKVLSVPKGSSIVHCSFVAV